MDEAIDLNYIGCNHPEMFSRLKSPELRQFLDEYYLITKTKFYA